MQTIVVKAKFGGVVRDARVVPVLPPEPLPVFAGIGISCKVFTDIFAAICAVYANPKNGSPAAILMHSQKWQEMREIESSARRFIMGDFNLPIPNTLWGLPVTLDDSLPPDEFRIAVN